ncbi:MAG: class I SAM-dependent methyltransferase [Anaerolineae bacterium]
MNLDEYARMYASRGYPRWYARHHRQHPQRRISAPRASSTSAAGRAALARLQENGWAVGCGDLSDVALQFAQRRGLRNLADASIEALPFKSESFDMPTCMDVLYHLQVQEDVAALRECYPRPTPRRLVPHQSAGVRVSLRGEHDRTVHTRHRYTVEELRGVRRSAGPRRARHLRQQPWLPVAAAKRILEPVIPLAARPGSSDVAGAALAQQHPDPGLAAPRRGWSSRGHPRRRPAVALAQRPPWAGA